MLDGFIGGPGFTIPQNQDPYSFNESDYNVDQLGFAPTDFAGIVRYNNQAAGLAAAADRAFQQSSAREAMAFEAEQAQMNRDFQQSSAREAMAFEADQAKINREFQQNMSDTAYQRAVADMRKAGINPILAYTQGGASTSSGATASGMSAGGSSARGYRSAGSRANVDMTTSADIIKSVVNASGHIFGSIINLFGSNGSASKGSVFAKLIGKYL